MARRSLLRQSWDETRAWIENHTRATVYGTTALVLVLLAVTVAAARNDPTHDAPTTVRADQSAMSTPTTFFGDDVLPIPGELAPANRAQPGVTLRSGNGLHLYTGTVPDYRGGKKSGGSPQSTATPRSPEATSRPGGNGGGATTTTLPPVTFGANRIAYVTGGGATWTVNPDGSDPRLVAQQAYQPAWAPSHAALAVVDGPNAGGVLSYITPTGERYALTPAPSGDGEGDSRPTWSPDGLRLAFGRIAFGNDGYSSIWVINKDGHNAKRIAMAGCFTSDPTWSADGTHIAFWSSRDHCTSGDDIGSYELYVMRSDGTGVRRLGTATNSGAPAFSPDGTQIAFASDRDGNFEIYVMNADGTGQTRLTTAPSEDTDPTWSPDGSRIAFRSARAGGGVYSMNANGTDLRLVVSGGTQPSWS